MLTIQEAGKQILTGNPGKFYIFVGEEYGIKCKYIEDMKLHYENWKEVDSVTDLFNMFRHKHIVPLQPTLYIVRYDENFYSYVSDKTASEIDKLNIIGTVVCIYESTKYSNRFDKYLPNYTVSFDKVNKTFIKKYLSSDFPELNNQIIDFAVSVKDDYNSASNICRSLTYVNSSVNISDLVHIFNVEDSASDNKIKIAFANKEYYKLLTLIEVHPNLDQIYYVILNTLIELERLIKNSYVKSDIREYVSKWTIADIYNMFMNTYEELKKIRSISSYKLIDSLTYLFSLMQYSHIPSFEVLQ